MQVGLGRRKWSVAVREVGGAFVLFERLRACVRRRPGRFRDNSHFHDNSGFQFRHNFSHRAWLDIVADDQQLSSPTCS